MQPASGWGQQSKYFDDELLLNGSYQIISVTIDKSTRDETNTKGSDILRAGLLLTEQIGLNGKYTTVDTSNGYLNGDLVTQYMNDVVVLARTQYVTKEFILGLTREREVPEHDIVAPAYFVCNAYSHKIYYNNMDYVQITDEQWEECQRISLVPRKMNIFKKDDDERVRALYYKRSETFWSPSEI